MIYTFSMAAIKEMLSGKTWDLAEVEDCAREWIEAVRKDGDKAALEYSEAIRKDFLHEFGNICSGDGSQFLRVVVRLAFRRTNWRMVAEYMLSKFGLEDGSEPLLVEKLNKLREGPFNRMPFYSAN